MLPLLKYLIGITELDDDDLADLKDIFQGYTRASFQNTELFDQYWEETLALRN